MTLAGVAPDPCRGMQAIWARSRDILLGLQKWQCVVPRTQAALS